MAGLRYASVLACDYVTCEKRDNLLVSRNSKVKTKNLGADIIKNLRLSVLQFSS